MSDVANAPDLLAETCVACRRDAPRVTDEEAAALTPLIPDWERQEHDGVPRLVRIFRFPNFRDALAFTLRVGELAEEEGHHPALLTEWGQGDRLLVDAQDPRAAPQRLHHGGQDRRSRTRRWQPQ